MFIVIEGQDATGKDTQATKLVEYFQNQGKKVVHYAEPAIKNNDIAIITRYWFSTYIYEGYGTGVSRSLITRLHKMIMPEIYFKPDKIVILTLSDKERQERMVSQRKRTKEFFKSQDAKYGKKLNDAYLKVAKEFNIPTLNTFGTPDEVFERLKKIWSI